MPRPARSARTLIALLLVVSTGLCAWFAHVLLPLEAETYYWTWGRALAWGFHDHPPAIAPLMRLGGVLGIDGPLGLRLGVVVLHALGSWWLWRLYASLLGDARGVVVAGVAFFAPFWLPFGVLATPDAPLLALWAGALLAFWRAWQVGGLGRWCLVGLVTGLACLAKYNGFQLLAVFLVTLVSTTSGRASLRTAGPWLGAAIALLVVSPNLVWNANTGASTVTTPFAESEGVGAAARHLALLAALPLFWLGPLLGVRLLGTARGVTPSDDGTRLLVAATWTPLTLFAGVALFTEVHVHWIATAFVGGLPLAMGATRERIPVAAKVGALLCVTTTLVLLGGPAWVVRAASAKPNAVPSVPSSVERLALEVSGWPALEARLRSEFAARDDDVFLTSLNYHMVAKAEWLLDGEVAGLPLRERHQHQYRLSRDIPTFVGRDALFVSKDREDTTEARILRAFDSVEWLEPVVLLDASGRQVERFVLAKCSGFRGLVGRRASR